MCLNRHSDGSFNNYRSVAAENKPPACLCECDHTKPKVSSSGFAAARIVIFLFFELGRLDPMTRVV
jgi:hypothetical protein